MNPNFCSYPFNHLSIGQTSSLRPCCVGTPFRKDVEYIPDLVSWWQNSPQYKEIRDSHRRGEQHPACTTCWQQEAVGNNSMRQRVTGPEDTDEEKLVHVEITGGRLCNLTCRMCSPMNSNQIIVLGRDSNLFDQSTGWMILLSRKSCWMCFVFPAFRAYISPAENRS